MHVAYLIPLLLLSLIVLLVIDSLGKRASKHIYYHSVCVVPSERRKEIHTECNRLADNKVA